jgi:hypothetical protein
MIVTNVEIMRMKIGILTSFGMFFLKIEIIKLENTSTNVAASPIPKPSRTVLEVANAGQSPIISTNTAFSFTRPRVKILSRFTPRTP